MTNKERLMKEFGRMEEERAILLDRLANIPSEKLEERPSPGAWSVSQVITHLAMAEEGALAYLRKKVEFGRHDKAPSTAAVRLWLLNTAMDLPIRYKAPKIIANIPETSIGEAVQRWAGVRMNMQKVFEGLREELVPHDLFKHPFAGKFNLVHGVQFMRRHVQHHRAQVSRILGKVGR